MMQLASDACMNKSFINNWYFDLPFCEIYFFRVYSDERWHNYHMTCIMKTKNTSTGVSPLAMLELGAIPSMGVNVEVEYMDQSKYTLLIVLTSVKYHVGCESDDCQIHHAIFICLLACG